MSTPCQPSGLARDAVTCTSNGARSRAPSVLTADKAPILGTSFDRGMGVRGGCPGPQGHGSRPFASASERPKTFRSSSARRNPLVVWVRRGARLRLRTVARRRTRRVRTRCRRRLRVPDGTYRVAKTKPVTLKAGKSCVVATVSNPPFDPEVNGPTGLVLAPEMQYVGYREVLTNESTFPAPNSYEFITANFRFLPASASSPTP